LKYVKMKVCSLISYRSREEVGITPENGRWGSRNEVLMEKCDCMFLQSREHVSLQSVYVWVLIWCFLSSLISETETEMRWYGV
jgi:hypothetical protein